jgi:hypothetical protein
LDVSLDASGCNLDSFLQKPVCWQNLVVIFENSYISYMTSFVTEIWSVDRSLSQESKKIRITSFRPLELTLCIKHRLNIKSANCLQFTPFCIFHPKVPSKHKTKNIKAFYIYNIGKTLVKCGWNYRIIWLHQIPPHLALAHPRERIDKIKLKTTMTNLLISHQCPRVYAL